MSKVVVVNRVVKGLFHLSPCPRVIRLGLILFKSYAVNDPPRIILLGLLGPKFVQVGTRKVGSAVGAAQVLRAPLVDAVLVEEVPTWRSPHPRSNLELCQTDRAGFALIPVSLRKWHCRHVDVEMGRVVLIWSPLSGLFCPLFLVLVPPFAVDENNKYEGDEDEESSADVADDEENVRGGGAGG